MCAKVSVLLESLTLIEHRVDNETENSGETDYSKNVVKRIRYGSANKVKNTSNKKSCIFIFILHIFWKSPGLRSQSPGFSELVKKDSRFECFGGWQVCYGGKKISIMANNAFAF